MGDGGRFSGHPALPKALVTVIVGTSLDPPKSKRSQTLPVVAINALWGELAVQLAESSGKSKLYDYVKETDRKGVSPSSATLRALFDALYTSPCLALMDELVAYVKKLEGSYPRAFSAHQRCIASYGGSYPGAMDGR